MAGTLTISTLSDGTNSTSTTNCIQGSAKAWVNFNGTTSPGTIRASFNVGSVTKNGTGDYTVNFTTAMPDANYATQCSGKKDGQTDNNFKANQKAGGIYSTTQVQVSFNLCTTVTAIDADVYCVSVFR